MDVREKLVELLDEAEEWANHKCDELDCETCPARKMKGNCFQQLMVGRIIDNGVTVQEWISVKDRLPEFGERVICTDGDAVFEQYRVEHSCVYGMWDRCGLKSPMQEVTHWMPLPEPPKGETNNA